MENFFNVQSEHAAIVVVSYNTREHLNACLSTLNEQGADEIIVVDNASSDGSAEMVRREFPAVHLIDNSVNVGYGAAVNQAVVQSSAGWIFLLNSDTRLAPGTLARLRQHGADHPRAAVIGPRIVHSDGSLQPSCYAFPTLLHVFLEESTLGRLLRHVPFLRQRYLRTWSHDEVRSVPWVLGAALLLRRSAFDAVQGFDPDFFLYAEEIDLAYRLRRAGWTTDFTPAVTITHEGGATTRQYRTAMAVQFFASLQKFYAKHYTHRQLLLLNALVRLIVALRLVRDCVLWPLAQNSARRRELRDRVAAWRQILRHFTSSSAVTVSPTPAAASRIETA